MSNMKTTHTHTQFGIIKFHAHVHILRVHASERDRERGRDAAQERTHDVPEREHSVSDGLSPSSYR